VTVRERFAAMGTTVVVLLEAEDGPRPRAALAAARAEFARLEAVLSRFQPGSELSRLNRARRLRAGPDLARVVGRALELRRRTGGRFDPTVGRAVRACGYDRTFADVPRDDPRPLPAPGLAGGAVALDGDGWIALGPGADLDLGAIAKGDAADRACAIAARAGACLVNAGGDIAVSGPRADGPWPIAVPAPGPDLVLHLERGALATSGTDRRRWRRGGLPAHHAIAPATGLPSPTDLVRATAVAATCAEADALATALLVAGADEAARLAADWGVPAALVAQDGGVRLAGGLR
jgi:thiamine biosynthesis lipoprotein